jgi:cytochrome c oxidase subunit 2
VEEVAGLATQGGMMDRRSKPGAVVLAGVVLVGLGLSGCGSSDGPAAGGSGNQVPVHVKGYSFDPAQLQLKAGQTVTFVVDNADPVEHNLTIDGLKVNQDVSGGKTAKVKAELAAGTYAFHCEYHPKQMTGTVTVT